MSATEIPLDEVVTFDEVTANPSTGAAADADSTPTFSVFEDADDTPILSAQNFTKRASLTGNYRGTFTASAANGFEAGKWYNVIASATVAAVAGKKKSLTFRLRPAETAAGVPKVDVAYSKGVEVFNEDFTLASATPSTVTLPTTDSAGVAIPDDDRYQYCALGLPAGTGAGQVVLLTDAGASARQYNVRAGSMPVAPDGTTKCVVLGSWVSNLELWRGGQPAALDGSNVRTKVYAYDTGTAPLQPTVAGRTLDVSLTGEAGIDWANVGSPTTVLNLSGTAVKTATDVETDTQNIQSRLPAALSAGRMVCDVQAFNNVGTTVTQLETFVGAYDGGNLAVNIQGTSLADVMSTLTLIDSATSTIPGIAGAVWDEVLASHLTSGTTGAGLNAAGSAGDPWATALPGAYGAGTAGRLVGRSLPDAVAGAAGGLVVAGSNAATTFATLTCTGAFSVNGVANVAQTGDSFARLGAAGAGLTALASAAAGTRVLLALPAVAPGEVDGLIKLGFNQTGSNGLSFTSDSAESSLYIADSNGMGLSIFGNSGSQPAVYIEGGAAGGQGVRITTVNDSCVRLQPGANYGIDSDAGQSLGGITGSLSGAVGSVAGDLAGKVLGGGAGTITGTGTRAVDGSGNAVAPASATAAIQAKTDLIPASPAAVGSAMTLADGAITEGKIATPAEAAGRPAGILGMIRRLFEGRHNKRVRNRTTGVVAIRNAADGGNLETATQATSGDVDSQSQGV